MAHFTQQVGSDGLDFFVPPDRRKTSSKAAQYMVYCELCSTDAMRGQVYRRYNTSQNGLLWMVGSTIGRVDSQLNAPCTEANFTALVGCCLISWQGWL